jgi:hypothetical protein
MNFDRSNAAVLSFVDSRAKECERRLVGPLQEESSRRAAREVEMRRFYNPMAAMAVGEARYDGLEGWAQEESVGVWRCLVKCRHQSAIVW